MIWFLFLFWTFLVSPNQSKVVISTSFDNLLINEVDPRFLSVAIGAGLVRNRWENFDFKSKRLINLAKALSPSYIRLGGTAADLMYFNETGASQKESVLESCSCSSLVKEQPKTPFIITGHDWTLITKFASQVGWKLLFDLNVLIRSSKNEYNTSNAKELLGYSTKKNVRNIAWELGNEPNSLHHSLGANISALALGKDFKKLRNLLDSFPLYYSSPLVGPDVNKIRGCGNLYFNTNAICGAFKYIIKVLRNSANSIDAITIHHYFLDGHNSTIKDFLNPKIFLEFELDLKALRVILEKAGFPNHEIWLGETASAYGGGAHGMSDRYIDGLVWLNKLGIAAANGVSVVIRQTYFGGCYSLIDDNLMPKPDYWVSLLYKQLVGTKILKVKGRRLSPGVTKYAACSKEAKGKVVFYIINATPLVQIDDVNRKTGGLLYSFTSDNGLRSKFIKLNGNKLTLINGEFVPNLLTLGIKIKNFKLYPYSITFYVPNQLYNVCM